MVVRQAPGRTGDVSHRIRACARGTTAGRIRRASGPASFTIDQAMEKLKQGVFAPRASVCRLQWHSDY